MSNLVLIVSILLLLVLGTHVPATAGRAVFVSSVILADVGNANNGSDLEVTFEPGNDTAAVYRVVIAKADQVVDSETLHYTEIEASGDVHVSVRLDAGATDTDGDLIVEGVAYVAIVLTLSEVDVVQSEPSPILTLANEAIGRTVVEELPAATGGVAVDEEGYIYVADIGEAPARHGSTVYRVSPDGASVEIFAEGFDGASGNAFDSQGNLYQSNISSRSISRITPEGEVSIFVNSGLSGPVGITIDADDTLYVANCFLGFVQRVTIDGESTRFAESPLFNCPNGIALDEVGNLYVANFSGGHVSKITPEGEVSDFASIPGGNNGHIVYRDGVLYVVARGFNQVYRLSLEGEYELLAGSRERGNTDGPALEASFSKPNGLAFSPDGTLLYINEIHAIEGRGNIPSRLRVIVLARDES